MRGAQYVSESGDRPVHESWVVVVAAAVVVVVMIMMMKTAMTPLIIIIMIKTSLGEEGHSPSQMLVEV